jgi:hypothetical protein
VANFTTALVNQNSMEIIGVLLEELISFSNLFFYFL